MPEVPSDGIATIGYSGEINHHDVYLYEDSYEFGVYGKSNGDSDSISPGRFDPTLTLYDGGTVLAYDDDGGNQYFDSYIEYTVDHSGWYLIAVAGHGDEVGDYRLHIDYSDSSIA